MLHVNGILCLGQVMKVKSKTWSAQGLRWISDSSRFAFMSEQLIFSLQHGGASPPPSIMLCSWQARWSGKKRQEDGGEEALCSGPAAADKITAQDILQCRQREQIFFFLKTMSPCAPAWGVHSIMRRIWTDTSHSHCGGGGWGGGDELFNQPAQLLLFGLVFTEG